MLYFIYFVEWVISFLAIWGLNWVSRYFFLKKFNEVTTAIFSFISVGIFSFIVAPYFISFPNPAILYLPFLFLFLIIDLKKSTQNPPSD